MTTIPLHAQVEAVTNVRLSPIAAVIGLGLIGHAIAGSLGAGIALLVPMTLTIIDAIIDV